MTRATVRTGIASFFGAGIYNTTDRVWRGGPLAGDGLGGVRAYFAKRVPDSDYTMGLTAGRGMGALMVVHLPQTQERRIALGGPTGGEKRVTFDTQLRIYHYARIPHTEDAQADFDALLEAIVDRVHADRTLGGAVTEAGEGVTGFNGGLIKTRMDEPFVRDEQTESFALINFDATVYVQA